ncbi:MAG TPA: hypothetical protein VF503_01285 [Sphingobium sp.]|uniref:hypothetical protein n=1 Tax=Sphingobium sp. TaxID=1912891 RepID=UPI002ED56A01
MSAVVAGERLKKALSRSAREAGLTISHVTDKTRPWSSCSFEGGKHEIIITAVDSRELRSWLDQHDQDSLTVHGFTLADLVVSTIEALAGVATITVDALTIAEA